MRKIVVFFIVLLSSCNVLAQSVLVQKGITYRYNGKNPRIPIGGVYVKTATSPNGVVSDEGNGTFALKLQNIKMGDRLGRATVNKAGLMIFNQQAVDEWSARKEPLKLILCDANQFQKQKNNLIAIGRNQAEKKYKKRLAELEQKNKAQQLTLDEYHAKLDTINRERDNAEKHMDEYADMFARIDESEVDSLAQRAIELFNQGQLEEAIRLFEQGNYLEKIDDALKIKTQAEELRQKADSAEFLADKDIEEYKKSIQAQVSAYKMSNDWDKAGELLKGLADKLQTLDAIWEYAIFSQNQNQFVETEKYYKLYINKLSSFSDTKSEENVQNLAKSYNNLANLYRGTQRFAESELMYKSALEIYKRLVEENPHHYSQQQANCLFWLADSQLKQEKYTEAISPLEKALEFYKKEAEQGESIDYYTTIMSWLHQLYGQEEKYSQAYLCFKQNIPLLKTLYQSDKSNYTELLNGILVAQSFYAIFEKQYVEAETYSRDALEVDSTKHIAYSNLAAALLFQGKYLEAEKIYRQYKAELKEDFLSDFDEFSKTGGIPKNREGDVEKIKQILLKK